MRTAKITTVLTAAFAVVALLVASSVSAYAPETFEAISSNNLAGGHPDFSTDFHFPEHPATGPTGDYIEQDGNVRDALAKLPAGMIGVPNALPQCTQVQFSEQLCPTQSQVGVAKIAILYPGGGFAPPAFTRPLYNMQPSSSDQTALLAFNIGTLLAIQFPVAVRTDSDYGLTVSDIGTTRSFGIRLARITVWGVPGELVHAGEWLGQRSNEPIDPTLGPPEVAFFTNPTRCDAPLEFVGEANSYQDPVFGSLTSTTPQLEGCDELDFSPTLEARPTTNATDSPSGLDVDLKLPQNADPQGRAEAELKDVDLTLPEGLVVNPSSANGLDACTPQQIGLTTPVGDGQPHFELGKPNCPTASRLGSVEVDTPVYEDPLKGSVYLASPHQNPFGSLLALYLTVEGHGLNIRLAGKVTPDPQTGRLTTTFEENPQTPFEHLRVHFDAGSVASLRTPATCGKYATTSVMVPWSAPETPVAAPKDEYEINQRCGTPANAPSFEAGSTAPLAGQYKPFVVNLRREDGTQQFSSVQVSPPAGLVAKLAGTQQCSDAAIASAATKSGAQEKSNPSCPSASAVGSVFAAAGAGPTPYNAPGTAYLAGPYKGAPLSLAIITPATAGPFDLGTIVVRTALYLDSKTAQVKAVSDPIPTILQGIPLDVRSVSIRLDKPQFTLNPTSCDPTEVSGSVLSTLNSATSVSSRFQLAECGRLKFAPQMALSLKGDTKRGGHPALTAVLKARPGDANIESVQVALPRSEFLAQNHIRTVCTRVQFSAGACPQRSIYGKVTVTTPLVDYPLSGPVYLRSSDNTLPDLVLDLHGPPSQPIHFEAAGKTDSIRGGIRNTFSFVPDVPFTKVVVRLQSGKKGLLENSRDICATTNKAQISFTAHNGETLSTSPPLKAKCGAKAKKGKKRSTKKHG